MKKIWFILVIGLFGLGLFPLKTFSQDSITQPTPQIIHPQANSTLSGTIVIEIYIIPTVVYQMDVYALTPNSSRIYIGTANQEGGTYFIKYWNTASVVNGGYQLWAEAKIEGGQITTYSQKVPVTIANQTSTTPRSTPTPAPSPTATALTTETPAQDEGTVVSQEGEATQNKEEVTGTPVTASAPKTEIPVPTPSLTVPPEENILDSSKIINTLSFDIFQDQIVRLEKIEARVSAKNQKFLNFVGKAYPQSSVTITINSQPLVMSVQTDAQGNWTYTLEKPLEPGKHETYVEVERDGKMEKNGPYPFTIAKAQASPENPNGESLELVSSANKAIINYIYLVSLAIVVAILVIAIIYLFRKKNRLKGGNNV